MKPRSDNLDLSTNLYKIAPANFIVTGSKGDIYTVTHDNGDWTCNCPHHTHRHVECKHIRQAKTNIINGVW